MMLLVMAMQEEEQVSLMLLPDYTSGSGEKDINVLNFTLRYAESQTHISYTG